MNETTLDELMKCSKEAIARAYMCRETFEAQQECPERSPNGSCVIGRGLCWAVTPQDWEKVLNSVQEKRGCLSPRL